MFEYKCYGNAWRNQSAIYDGQNDDVLFTPRAVLLRARVRTAKQVDTTGFWLRIDLNSYVKEILKG